MRIHKIFCSNNSAAVNACEPKSSDWVRPIKAFHNEMWLHYGFALLMLGIYLAGWFSDLLSLPGAGVSIAAGCVVALILMRGYKICRNDKGEKIAIVERNSLVLRSIYLISRTLAVGLFRSPWPGVASVGGSVVMTVIIFQFAQGVYLHARLLNT
ncbi:hypothetical protein ANAEL_04898 [Anaerolineales bacterium]|jgi:hypothetical protein|nr:hypothetical protein ANAEL_04898 [Anaerolineales bacterium]